MRPHVAIALAVAVLLVALSAGAARADDPVQEGFSVGLGGGSVVDLSASEQEQAFMINAHLGYRFAFGLEPTLLLMHKTDDWDAAIGARYGISLWGFRPYVEAGLAPGSEDHPLFPEVGAGVERRLIGALHASAYVGYLAALGKPDDREDLLFGGLGVSFVQ